MTVLHTILNCEKSVEILSIHPKQLLLHFIPYKKESLYTETCCFKWYLHNNLMVCLFMLDFLKRNRWGDRQVKKKHTKKEHNVENCLDVVIFLMSYTHFWIYLAYFFVSCWLLFMPRTTYLICWLRLLRYFILYTQVCWQTNKYINVCVCALWGGNNVSSKNNQSR